MEIPETVLELNVPCPVCHKTLVIRVKDTVGFYSCPECGATYPVPESWAEQGQVLLRMAALQGIKT